MRYIILFFFIILLIYIFKNNISSNFIVPYTIKNDSIDFIHYGYFTNNIDVSKKSDNIFYNAQLNLIKELIKNIKINKNDYILDVGCGVGGFIKYLNANYSNLNIIGVDTNDLHINIAKNKNKLLNNNNIIEYYNVDINMFYPKNKINKIFAIECGFHFNKYIFLNNAFKYLDDNGTIIIADIVTTSKIKNYLNKKLYIDNVILKSFGIFNSFWNPFNYQEVMKKIGYNNIEYKDITNETLESYVYLEKYAYEDTLEGILLLKELHKKGCLKYIIIKATK